ncbi:MAG: gephyrin-like molybdotransferase Glp [Chloroflexota bacterium]
MAADLEPGKLISADAALAAVLEAVPGLTDAEWVHLSEAVGRVAAEDVVSALDLPPWDNSAMDGYALRHGDIETASAARPVVLEVTGDVPAGADNLPVVRRGTAVRIATGARIPPWADCVVPVEQTTAASASGDAIGSPARDATGPLPAAILIGTPLTTGASVRRQGSDLRAGTTVLKAGSEIRPATIAVLAGAAHGGLLVHRRPLVGVLATGDEIRSPGSDLGPAGIPDANGPALHAYIEAAGGSGQDLGIAGDRIEDVRSRLAAGIAAGYDAIIVSGGVSVGPYDHVRTAFAAYGTIELWRVAVQPGKPFVFGTAPRPGGGRPILLFGLPGNPVSTFVTFELFVRPALRRLGGHPDTWRRVDQAVLMEATPKSSGRRAFIRVRADRDALGTPIRDDLGRVILRLSGGVSGQGSHVLSALAEAEGLAIIPEDVDTHPAGGAVTLWWLDQG